MSGDAAVRTQSFQHWGMAGSLLTLVRDLTFDLTFCRLFSFFLLKAFFPLKANSDTQFFHALHASLMVTAKHVSRHFLSFSRESRRQREPAILLHPRLRNDLFKIDPISPANTTAVQVAQWLEIVINKGESNTVLNARHCSLRQMELKWDEVKGQTAANTGGRVALTHVKRNWLHREGPDSAANLLFF